MRLLFSKGSISGEGEGNKLLDWLVWIISVALTSALPMASHLFSLHHNLAAVSRSAGGQTIAERGAQKAGTFLSHRHVCHFYAGERPSWRDLEAND